jgi:hypothetical protein
MVCIKRGQIVIRVKNDNAAALVTEGWRYASKAEWKKSGRRMYK